MPGRQSSTRDLRQRPAAMSSQRWRIAVAGRRRLASSSSSSHSRWPMDGQAAACQARRLLHLGAAVQQQQHLASSHLPWSVQQLLSARAAAALRSRRPLRHRLATARQEQGRQAARQAGVRLSLQRPRPRRRRRPQCPSRPRRHLSRCRPAWSSRACLGSPCWRARLNSLRQRPARRRRRQQQATTASGLSEAGAAAARRRARRRAVWRRPLLRLPPSSRPQLAQRLAPLASSAASDQPVARRAAAQQARRRRLCSRSSLTLMRRPARLRAARRAAAARTGLLSSKQARQLRLECRSPSTPLQQQLSQRRMRRPRLLLTRCLQRKRQAWGCWLHSQTSWRLRRQRPAWACQGP